MTIEMKYFVLKPTGVGNYAEASRQAMIAYAKSIRPVDYQLANDLLTWVETEEIINRKNRIKMTKPKGAA